MEKRLEKRRSAEGYNGLREERKGARSRRSRRRSRKKSALPKVLGAMLLCTCLGVLSWGAVRYVRGFSGDEQKPALETSRQSTSETLPESETETFR